MKKGFLIVILAAFFLSGCRQSVETSYNSIDTSETSIENLSYEVESQQSLDQISVESVSDDEGNNQDKFIGNADYVDKIDWDNILDTSIEYLSFKTVDGTKTITGYTGYDDVVKIPESINGMPVTAIADNAFKNNMVIGHVRIPDSVTTIGVGAFEGSSVISVNIPKNFTAIPEKFVKDCLSFESVNVSERVSLIGRKAFSGCNSLKSVIISEGIMEIGGGAFEKCQSLKSVTLPYSLATFSEISFLGDGQVDFIYGNESYSIYCSKSNSIIDDMYNIERISELESKIQMHSILSEKLDELHG